LYRLFFPLYLMGLLIAGGSFVVAEWIMPPANRRAREILRVEIQGRSLQNLGSRPNLTYLGQNNRKFVIRRYDVPRAVMQGPSIQEFDGDRLVRRLDAATATYRGGAWVLEKGQDRRFDADGKETAAGFDSLRLVIPETPEDFAKEQTAPEEMTFPELQRYTERVRQSGSQVQAYETDLQLRLAFPFSNVVVILIASSLAVQVRRGGVALGFGFSLAIAFAYWCLIRAGQVLGNNGTLPPLAAAWIGNVAFLGFGVFLLVRTPK
jgi:lipopolysaccharide export system permease protein